MAAMKKHRQHYVWRHYLEAWTTNGALWCRRAGKVFEASTQNIAHRRDFYRLRELSESDLDIVYRAFIKPMPPEARELAEGWIPAFTEVFNMRRLYEASGRKDAALEVALDTTINNLEEDLYSRLEDSGQALLVALRAGDASVFDGRGDGVINAWFIGAQYFRTPRMLARAVATLSAFPFNAEAAFGLMRTIFATNLGYALWSRRATLKTTFLRATGGATFITGDQPILNTRGVGLPAVVPPSSLELYYPLTPESAVLFDLYAGVKSTQWRTLATDEVAAYNQLTVSASHEQVYGVRRDVLEMV